MASPALCPLCKQLLPGTVLQYDADTRSVIRNGKATVLTPKQYRVFAELVKRRPAGASKEQLFTAMYYDDIDGGPATGTVTATVTLLRQRLAPLGLRIDKAAGWHRVYTLVESHRE